MNTLPKSSAPYDTLSLPVLRDLISIIHYTLLFHNEIKISPHLLLFPTSEKSILQAQGQVFELLLAHVYGTLSINTITQIVFGDETEEEKAQEEEEEKDKSFSVDESDDESEDKDKENEKKGRKRIFIEKMKRSLKNKPIEIMLEKIQLLLSYSASNEKVRNRIMKKNSVESAVRLKAGVRDALGTGYVWVRGIDGCASGRIVASGRVWAGEDLQHVANAIDIRGKSGGGRCDLIVASWLRDRMESSEFRGKKIIDQWNEQELKRIELEKEREIKLQKLSSIHPNSLLVAGQEVDLDGCGRGKRERKTVSYDDNNINDVNYGYDDEEEEDDSDDHEEEDDTDDNEEEFVAENEEEEEDADADADSSTSKEEESIMRGPRTRGRLQAAKGGRGKKRARIVLDSSDDSDSGEERKKDEHTRELEIGDSTRRSGRKKSNDQGKWVDESENNNREKVEPMVQTKVEVNDLSSSRAARAARRRNPKHV